MYILSHMSTLYRPAGSKIWYTTRRLSRTSSYKEATSNGQAYITNTCMHAYILDLSILPYLHIMQGIYA